MKSLVVLLLLSVSLSACGGSIDAPSVTSEDEAVCCGCLCVDASWSCSQDTCVTAGAQVVKLAPESGFLEIAGRTFTNGFRPARTPRERVWYSFFPASDAPEDKPLAVFMNGGPGYSTMMGLFALNTAPRTLDPERTGAATWADNPSTWTSFANLLYIDMPGAGFSYHMPRADGDAPEVEFEPTLDAATFLRVVIRFLERHPQLDEVVLVGESYGGTRSALMLTLLHQLLTYGDIGFPDLRADAAAYLARMGMTNAADVSAHFTRQVLVQPLLSNHQYTGQWNDDERCLEYGAPHQCDVREAVVASNDRQIAERLVDPETLQSVLLIDPSTIAWLRPDARHGAYPRDFDWDADTPPDERALDDWLGALESEDSRFTPSVRPRGRGLSRSYPLGRLSLEAIHRTPTFMTAAALDTVIVSAKVAEALAKHEEVVMEVSYDAELFSEADRPGGWLLRYQPDGPTGGGTRVIRGPWYADAGHMVSWRQPEDLRADVAAWLAAP